MFKLTRTLYFWVLLAIVFGAWIGAAAPETAVELKVLGDGFISLIKMVIAPIIFCSVALGISGTSDLKKVGRIGGKALLYFEVVSTFALALGLLVANVLRPGASFHANVSTLDAGAITEYATKAHESSLKDFLMHLLPRTFFEPLMGTGDLLQVLLIAALFGFALHELEPGRKSKMNEGLDILLKVFFKLVSWIMYLAPLGAFGAMAFTVGKYGLGSLKPLFYLMMCFYLTCILFIFLVLGAIARYTGFSIFKYLRYILAEILLVLGTSSSESALAPLMEKLERLGCERSIVGLVVPTGYSFNLDGTNIYLTLACLFIAQAFGIDLSISKQLGILAIAMLSSKGASGVTGAGFITLAATLSIVPEVPLVGLTLILGVDRFMSEARAITNMIGNGVATLVVAKWEGELDMKRLHEELG
jgi:aerobic C4-dicarboxylate transport protein